MFSHTGVGTGLQLHVISIGVCIPEGGGGPPRKIGWECAARFPKPLPYL